MHLSGVSNADVPRCAGVAKCGRACVLGMAEESCIPLQQQKQQQLRSDVLIGFVFYCVGMRGLVVSMVPASR